MIVLILRGRRLKPAGRGATVRDVDPRMLRELSPFAHYSLKEIRRLLCSMRRWDVTARSIIFTEGSLGERVSLSSKVRWMSV